MFVDEKNNTEPLPSLDEIYDKISNQLLFMGSTYLYTQKRASKIIPLNEIGKTIPDNEHHWKIKEHKFGQVLMITSICTLCFYGTVEVIPVQIRRGSK